MTMDPKKPIKIIDLFAGPGGLGEGFSNCKKNSPFEISMSVEFEPNAHKTLTLRALYRKLTDKEKSKYYYPYIQSTNASQKKERGETLRKHCADKWEAALHETMGSPHALGHPEKWRKIKDGERLTPKDHKPTEQEKAIFERVADIKKNHKGPIIVIGGPPCQAYSVNGRNRQKAEKDYKPENDERFFLYQEYLKVLDAAEPDIFIMENVEGILTAKMADGELIFQRIKRDLVRPDNKPSEQYDIYSLVKKPETPSSANSAPIYNDDHDYVIKASDFGVPQGRKRVILMGIKRKYKAVDKIMLPVETGSTPNTGELIGALPRLRSGLSKEKEGPDTTEQWMKLWASNQEELCNVLGYEKEVEQVAKRWIAIDKKEREKAKKPPYTTKEIKEKKKQYTSTITTAFNKTLSEVDKLTPINTASNGNDFFLPAKSKSSTFRTDFANRYPDLYKWLYRDIGGVANHKTRGHMKDDLKRYMFSAAWAKAHNKSESPSPKSKNFPKAISPQHKNWETGNHADRFRTIEASMIPLTITSHLRKDGHAQIHYDATQNRSLTVREAARIQTFPDDYYFEGPQGWQFQQVGNAVPSFLAKQIAEHVLKIMKDKKIV